jgi:anti-sigma regulatory factor (Ser/Thr protein kinase)
MMIINCDEELQSAQVMICEFLERYSQINAPEMEVAINEAMNNGYYSSGRVRFRLKRMGDKLIVRVRDDGQGFNTKKVNVQLKTDLFEEKFEQVLEAEGGRGILLMKLFCDRVIYNDKGNEVLLMKQIH